MLKNRASQKTEITTSRPGPQSPLTELDTIIVEMILTAADINAALDATEIIALTNNMIQGTPWQEDVENFQRKYCPSINPNNFVYGQVGIAWFRSFRARNSYRLNMQTEELYAGNRSDWQKYEFHEQMYNKIYQTLVEAKIARH